MLFIFVSTFGKREREKEASEEKKAKKRFWGRRKFPSFCRRTTTKRGKFPSLCSLPFLLLLSFLSIRVRNCKCFCARRKAGGRKEKTSRLDLSEKKRVFSFIVRFFPLVNAPSYTSKEAAVASAAATKIS